MRRAGTGSSFRGVGRMIRLLLGGFALYFLVALLIAWPQLIPGAVVGAAWFFLRAWRRRPRRVKPHAVPQVRAPNVYSLDAYRRRS